MRDIDLPCRGCGVPKDPATYCVTAGCDGHYDSEPSRRFRATIGIAGDQDVTLTAAESDTDHQRTTPTEVIHIAGWDIQVGQHLRQRCGWCGATLIDYTLDGIAVLVGQDPRPATWPVGDLVAVDGAASYTIPHADGAELPPQACAQLDPEVTK